MNAILGTVKDGKVELDSPLPDGTRVEVHLIDDPHAIAPAGFPQELWDELRPWQLASAKGSARFDEWLEEESKREPG